MSSNLQLFNKTLSNPKTQDYLQQVLAEKKSAFVNNITALVANDVKLQTCEPISLMYAGIKATALDLPLDANLGFAYVIPYNNRKAGKTEAQFQMGYKGFIQLAIRSGQFKTLNVTDVKEGELKEVNLLTGEIAFESRPNRAELKTIGYVAYFRLTNGFEKTLYMDAKEMEKHAKTYSQTYSSKNDYVRKASKWTTDFDAMAKKTVIKLLLSRYAPLSVEMQSAITSDQSVMDDKGTHYIDHTTAEEAVAEEIADNANQEEIDAPEAPEQAQSEEATDEPGF
jgi:recombination protein RecT